MQVSNFTVTRKYKIKTQSFSNYQKISPLQVFCLCLDSKVVLKLNTYLFSLKPLTERTWFTMT